MRYIAVCLSFLYLVEGIEDSILISELSLSDLRYKMQPMGKVNIQASAFISNLEVDENNEECRILLYYTERWSDSRLAFSGPKEISLDGDEADRIWMPDTHISSAKRVDHLRAPKPNRFARISNNGNVTRTERILVTQDCHFNFRSFPFDRQRMTVEFSSFGYNMESLDYEWTMGEHLDESANPAVDYDEAMAGIGFALKEISNQRQTKLLSTGTYTILSLSVNFERHAGSYFLYLFFPTTLTLSLLWFCPWFQRESPHTYYGVLYALAAFFFYLVEVAVVCCWYAPKLRISYMTLMGIWIFFGFCYGFCAIFESALAAILAPNYASFVRIMDWVSRIVFPILLVGVILLYLFFAGLI